MSLGHFPSKPHAPDSAASWFYRPSARDHAWVNVTWHFGVGAILFMFIDFHINPRKTWLKNSIGLGEGTAFIPVEGAKHLLTERVIFSESTNRKVLIWNRLMSEGGLWEGTTSLMMPFRAPSSGYLFIYLLNSRLATYWVWLHIIETYKRRQSQSPLSSHCSNTFHESS